MCVTRICYMSTIRTFDWAFPWGLDSMNSAKSASKRFRCIRSRPVISFLPGYRSTIIYGPES